MANQENFNSYRSVSEINLSVGNFKCISQGVTMISQKPLYEKSLNYV